MGERLEALLGYCTASDRICPMPCQWDDFWVLLKRAARERSLLFHLDDIGEPPAPKILSSWVFSDDWQKRSTLLAQVKWADAHGALREADQFLRGLAVQDWKYGSGDGGGWTRDDWEESRREVRERELERQERSAIRREAKSLSAEEHRQRKPQVDQRYYDSLDGELVAAYRATTYVVFDTPPIELEIGECNAHLADLFAKEDVTCGAYVTAWNARGKASSAKSNRVAQERLIAIVESEGLAWLPGEGQGKIGDWPPEASILILGCTRPMAKKLGHLFRQNAILWIGEDAVPELVFLMPIRFASIRKSGEIA